MRCGNVVLWMLGLGCGDGDGDYATAAKTATPTHLGQPRRQRVGRLLAGRQVLGSVDQRRRNASCRAGVGRDGPREVAQWLDMIFPV